MSKASLDNGLGGARIAMRILFSSALAMIPGELFERLCRNGHNNLKYVQFNSDAYKHMKSSEWSKEKLNSDLFKEEIA